MPSEGQLRHTRQPYLQDGICECGAAAQRRPKILDKLRCSVGAHLNARARRAGGHVPVLAACSDCQEKILQRLQLER